MWSECKVAAVAWFLVAGEAADLMCAERRFLYVSTPASVLWTFIGVKLKAHKTLTACSCCTSEDFPLLTLADFELLWMKLVIFTFLCVHGSFDLMYITNTHQNVYTLYVYKSDGNK